MLTKNLQKNLKAKMIASGIKSGRAMEVKSGVAKSMVNMILAEAQNTSIKTVDALAEAFRLPGWFLLMDPDVFSLSDASSLEEAIRNYVKLSPENQEKTLIYINDLLAAQKTRN